MSAAIQKLLSNADATTKAELESLTKTVNGALTQAQADLTTAQASISSLTKERDTLLAGKTDFEAKITKLDAAQLAFNTELSEACLNAELFNLKDDDDKPLPPEAPPETKKKAMMALPVADKFKAYQGSLNAAFAKANLPNSTLPKAPVKEPGAAAQNANGMKRDAYFKMSPKDQLAFVNGGGKITD